MPAQTKLSLAFCVFTSALCEIVCPIWFCLFLIIIQRKQIWRTSNNKLLEYAIEGANCEHCDVLPLRTLRSRLAFFQKEDILEWLGQTLPVGSPFQDVVLTAQLHINPETLVEFLTA